MNEQSKTRRGKLMVAGTLALFAMGGLSAEAHAKRDKDEPRPVPPANDETPTGDGAAQARPTQTVHHFHVPAGTMAEVAAGIQKETGLKVVVASRVADLAS